MELSLVKIEDLSNAGVELQKTHSSAIELSGALQARIAKAKAYIENHQGIDSDEVDQRVQKLINECSTAAGTIAAQRMPYTRFLQTVVVGAFTKIENDLKDGADIKFLVDARNKRARALIEERKRIEAEQAKKNRQAQQRQQLRIDAAQAIAEAVYNAATEVVNDVAEIWNRQTPETIDGFLSVIRSRQLFIERADYNNLKVVLSSSRYPDITDEAASILAEVKESLFESSSITYTQRLRACFAAYTTESIAERKREMLTPKAEPTPAPEFVSQFPDGPSTIAEFEAQKKAESIAAISQSVVSEAKAQQATDLFASITDLQAAPVISVKTKKVIEITETSAIAVIFTFWYQREGANLSVEEITKKTIKQMIAFAEKMANSTGEMITHSGIQYLDDIKAK